MHRTDDGEVFPPPESSVSAAPRGTAREPAAPRGIAAAPALPSERARSAMAAAARRRLEFWARHALAANGFGAAGPATDGGRP